MKLKQKTKKQLFFFIPILIILSIILPVVAVYSPLSPFDASKNTYYITSGDVIKNFKLESFDGDIISSGGGYDNNHLKFETGALWTVNPDDVNVITVYQVGDKVYFNYDITFFNDLNVYTNDRLGDVVATGKTADAITESIACGMYQHNGLFGDLQNYWLQYLYWQHLDVGDIRTKTIKDNTYGGDLVMSFDINSSPLPDVLVDSNGNPANKTFDYIGIKTIYVDSSSYGLLSDDMPEVVGLTPATYEFTINDVKAGALGGFASGDSVTAKYQPNPKLSATFVKQTVDLGVQSQSVGSSLNPTKKNGGALFDPKISEESMTDCQFTYNVGSISPLVTEYANTLTYQSRKYGTQDVIVGPFQFGLYVLGDLTWSTSTTRTTALQVSNRYIQTSIGITFSVWSSYEVQALESGDIPKLQFPQEYYDNLVFSSVVDGFGGGMVYQEEIPFNLFGFLSDFFSSVGGILTMIIVIAIIGIVVYVAFKVFISKRAKTVINLKK